MKTLRQSVFAKGLAVLLLCAMVLICAGSAGGAFYLSESGAYTLGYEAAAREAVSGLGTELSYDAGDRLRSGIMEKMEQSVNFRCTILNRDGEELYSDYEGEKTLWDEVVEIAPNYSSWMTTVEAETEAFEPQPDDDPTVTPTPVPMEEATEELPVTPEPFVTPRPTAAPSLTPPQTEACYVVQDYMTGERREFNTQEEVNDWVRENTIRVHGYILRDLQPGDAVWGRLHVFNILYNYRTLWPALAVGSLLLGILLFLFLLGAAGWHRGEEQPRESFADRIPFDLFTILILSAETVVFAGIFGPGWSFDAVGLTFIALLLLLAGLIFLFWCMSLAVRVKCGTVWKNNLITHVWRWLVKLCKTLGSLAVRGLKALPMMGRWAVIIGGLLFVDFLLTAMYDGGSGNAWLLFFLRLFVLYPALLYIVWQMRKLRLAAKEIAKGNLNASVDTKGMFLELKEHAEDLNAIRDGVNAAVEERMKSERFRTELITNVSHDIKTPLTSIVSYVDLLEKEELQNETARGYVEVLSRQAARLKKLIEDLMDASKASTGALTVNWETLELGVLLDQAAGEYRERMEKAGLEMLVSKPERPVQVRGDGRHMWRIFDNLLGNIVKYAQPGTRVYLDLAAKDGSAEITFRNISRSRLNVNGEELAERFVRGDASRSSEGSGLGLSIAMSLAQLQKGEMHITVDGDLFKVSLVFDEAE